MESPEKGLVPAKEPKEVFLSLNPAYLSRNEMRDGKTEPRPVLFVNTYGKTEPYASIGEAIADVADDKDLPKGTLIYVNGRYLSIKDAVKLANDLHAFCYKRAGRDAPTHKVQFWTNAAAAKSGLAFGTKAKAKAKPTAKNAKSVKKARY